LFDNKHQVATIQDRIRNYKPRLREKILCASNRLAGWCRGNFLSATGLHRPVKWHATTGILSMIIDLANISYQT